MSSLGLLCILFSFKKLDYFTMLLKELRCGIIIVLVSLKAMNL